MNISRCRENSGPAAQRRALGPIVRASITTLLVALALESAAFAVDGSGLTKVELLSPDGTGRSASAPFSSKIGVELALGENIEEQVVALTAVDDSEDTFRVQVQYETALAVGDEGPHLDLVAWRGCKSPWRQAEQILPLQFRLPRPTEAEATCFPKVSGTDIRAEVAKRGGRRWAKLVKEVHGPTSPPLYVAIAYVHIAVQRISMGAWHTLFTITVKVPMGC